MNSDEEDGDLFEFSDEDNGNLSDGVISDINCSSDESEDESESDSMEDYVGKNGIHWSSVPSSGRKPNEVESGKTPYSGTKLRPASSAAEQSRSRTIPAQNFG
ncbi:hypothetical protein RP20_CCG000330 [Aedes albopictus]|nr:hypothetical protein RP20_CCG000330 [Aedes albopictus]